MAVGHASLHGLEIRCTPNAGRGVFAARDFAAGQVIERSPVIALPAKDIPAIRNTVLARYSFQWADGGVALALGYGSLYNHSSEPNCVYWTIKDEGVIEFVALVDIRAGEELRVNYNGNPQDTTARWFDEP